MTSTAMHVNAAMNSYMLPHGTRSSASPRVVTAMSWDTSPTQVRPNAVRSQKPVGPRRAGEREPPAVAGCGAAPAGAAVVAPGAAPAAMAALPLAAPTPASWGTLPGAATASRRCFANAKSHA
jgi:hypothetical protein